MLTLKNREFSSQNPTNVTAVIPILKDDHKSITSKYRPVSLASIEMKTFILFSSMY